MTAGVTVPEPTGHIWQWAQTPPARSVQVTAQLTACDVPTPIAGELNLKAVVSAAGAPRIVNYMRYGLFIDRRTATVAGQPLTLTGEQALIVVMKHPSIMLPSILEETYARLIEFAPRQYAALLCVNVVPVVTGNARYLRAGVLRDEAAVYGRQNWQRRLVDGTLTPLTQRQLNAYDRVNAVRVNRTAGAHPLPSISNLAFIAHLLATHPDADVLLATGNLRGAVAGADQQIAQAYSHLLQALAPLGAAGRLLTLGVTADGQFGRSPRPQNPRDDLPRQAGAWTLQPVAVSTCGHHQSLTRSTN
ncbi:hypothetical protein [Lacticaseibacillus absianus]|uniref:hypothetical protein n=1 Tax=Lacticaseibacillus absianus TaxID=2729623 RepID=UPI0015CAD0A4|nr:hypothetical protein [Lacticaseibacillus absianus]